MKAYQRILTTPRSQWTRQLVEAGFEDAVAALQGCLTQETEFAIDQAAINEKKRSVNGTASVEEVSRTFYLIRIDGLDIRQFKKNPVVLASHSACAYGTLMPGAIGTVGSVSKSGNSLLFKNMTFDEDPLADAWWQKILRRTVRMVSIGFLPLEWAFVEEQPKKKGDPARWYVDITKSELLEISPVCIGANRGAFIDYGRESAKFLSDRAEEADDTTQGRLADRVALIEKSIQELIEQVNSKATPATSANSASQMQEAIARLDRAIGDMKATKAA